MKAISVIFRFVIFINDVLLDAGTTNQVNQIANLLPHNVYTSIIMDYEKTRQLYQEIDR